MHSTIVGLARSSVGVGPMERRPLRLFSCSLLAVACLSSELSAQTTTSGGLTGVITDQSKALIPDAAVEIKDAGKGTTQTTKTDQQGVYRFFFLAPARYLLTVSHQGFRKESRTVTVLLGPPVSVNVTLELRKQALESRSR